MARESPKYSCATRPVPELDCYLCYSARPEPEYYLCYPTRGPGPAPCRPLLQLTRWNNTDDILKTTYGISKIRSREEYTYTYGTRKLLHVRMSLEKTSDYHDNRRKRVERMQRNRSQLTFYCKCNEERNGGRPKRDRKTNCCIRVDGTGFKNLKFILVHEVF
jgi:hypothetical protein